MAALMFLAAMMSGCGEDQPPPPTTAVESNSTVAPPVTQPVAADRIVATVRGHEVTLSELQAPLIEAYGLTLLRELVQVDLAQQDADQQGIKISDQDVVDETTKTLIDYRNASGSKTGSTTEPSSDAADEKLSPQERDQLLNVLMTAQHLTPTEFQLFMKRNAIVRKLVSAKAQLGLTDENIHERFNAIYGEKAHVRIIRLPSLKAVAVVENALHNGHTFEEEVGLHAYDPTGQVSAGELLPFTRKDVNFKPELRMAAFDLKPGQVSDPLQIDDGYCLIQMIELIPPQHAKFEDYQDAVKKDLYEHLVQEGIKQYLKDLGVVAQESIEIKDPVLSKQWEQTLKNYRDADELRAALRKQQEAATSRPDAGAPAATQEAAPATVPGF
jgi:foldase protein PrsA